MVTRRNYPSNVEEMNMQRMAHRNLKFAAIAALIGVSYIFIIRTISTILPGLFTHLSIAQANTVAFLIASLVILLFFIVFYGHYVQKDQVKLAGATLLAILGQCGTLVLRIKTLFRVFNIYLLTSFVYSYHFLDRFVPWVSSLFIFVFFYIFYRELEHSNKQQLKNATILAALGSFVILLMQTFFMFHYFFTRGVIPIANIPPTIGIIFYIMVILNFCAMLYFFISFYRSIDTELSSHQAEAVSPARATSP